MKNLIYNKSLLTDEHGREYYLDNAKFILIFFVVMAHLFGTLKHADVTYVSYISTAVWNYLNTFHMATFIFISGYLAKRFVKKGYTLQKPVTYFLIYVFAQLLFTFCEKYWWSGDPASETVSIFKAEGSLWYLQCLIIWYLLLPMLDQVKPKYMIGGAILIALAVGYDTKVNDYLSFSRVLVHMPFFMAGYYTDKNRLDRLNQPKVKLGAWAALLVIFVVEFCLYRNIPGNLLPCNSPYRNCGLKGPAGVWWLYRLAFYLVVFVMIFSFLAVVPRCKTFFSKWGSRTLAVYLFHRIFYRCFEEYGWYKAFGNSWLGLIALFFVVAAVTCILSLKPFSVPFDLIQKIKITGLLKDKTTAESK